MQNAFITQLLARTDGAAAAPVQTPAQTAEVSTDDASPALLITTERIRTYRQRFHPAPDPPADENIEMHDSALFDPPVVEIAYYTGERIRIPQRSTPAGWVSPF